LRADGFGYWVRVLWDRRWWVVAPVLLGIVCGLIWSLSIPVLYTARATINIRGLNENYLDMKDVDPNAGAGEYPDSTYVQTQISILQSSALVNRVIRDLKLLNRPDLFDPPTRLPGLSAFLDGRRSDVPVSIVEARRSVLKNLSARLVGQSRIVEVSFQNPDRHVAAALVNTLAERYCDFTAEARIQEAERTRHYLAAQLNELKRKLEDSGYALQRFAEGNKLLITGEKNNVNVAEERLRQLQDEMSRAQADRIAKQSRLAATAEASPDLVPEVLDSGPLREYQVKLAELRRQRAEASTLYAPTSYKVRRIDDQIAELERTAEQERMNVMKRSRNEYDAAAKREAALTAVYAEQSAKVMDQSAKLIRYGMLRSEVDTNRAVYDSVLQKTRQAGVAAAMRPPNAHVIDAAEVPEAPSSTTGRNLFLGSLAGVLTGILLVFARQRSDASMHLPGDAAAYLNVRELGAIPRTKQTGAARVLAPFRAAKGLTAPEALDGDRNFAQLVTQESYRTTVASILSVLDSQDRVLVVTSACPREGKTTTVHHIGVMLAHIGYRVLIVDGDLRRPEHHKLLNLDLTPGLSDLLIGSETITLTAVQKVIRRTSQKDLFVVPAGGVDRNAADLLYRTTLQQFVGITRRTYDFVLIDTPPMLHMADARLFARQADGVILVLRARQTATDLAHAALQRFAEDNSPVIGTLLTGCDPKSVMYGYGRQKLYR
jgi:capsular exopolysaccharide synthesis family protein